MKKTEHKSGKPVTLRSLRLEIDRRSCERKRGKNVKDQNRGNGLGGELRAKGSNDGVYEREVGKGAFLSFCLALLLSLIVVDRRGFLLAYPPSPLPPSLASTTTIAATLSPGSSTRLSSGGSGGTRRREIASVFVRRCFILSSFLYVIVAAFSSLFFPSSPGCRFYPLPSSAPLSLYIFLFLSLLFPSSFVRCAGSFRRLAVICRRRVGYLLGWLGG